MNLKFLEAVQLVGSIAGLVTFAYTLVDRLMSKRPLARLTATIIAGVPQYSIEVENISRSDILVRSLTAGKMPVASKNAATAYADAIAGRPAYGLVRAGEGKAFALLDVRQNDSALPVTFRVSWRKADSSWLPQIPIRRRYSADDVRIIGEGGKRGREFKIS